MPGFKLPAVEDNTEGWGPTTAPEQFANVPFMPFGKGERLGRIAEFGMAAGRQAHYQNRYREPAPGTSVFNFEKAEEDEAFEIVDNKPVKKPTGGPQRRPPFQQGGRGWGQQGGRDGGRGDGGRGGRHDGGRGGRGGRGQQFGGFRQPWRDQNRVQYTASVDIRPEWVVLGDQIALSALHKLSTNPGDCEELLALGSLAQYDRAADRVTPKAAAKLRRAGAKTHTVSIAEDSVIQKLAAAGEGDVFISDAVLAVLMTAPRSVYPWDLLFIKRGDQLFIDRRPGSTLEYLTNGETAPDPIQEDRDAINGVQQLSAEATGVNQAFREQVLSAPGGAAHALGEALSAELAATGIPPPGYRYRRWTLGDTRLVVRCEVDAHVKAGDGVQIAAVHALNEFDPKWSGVDWRMKLENQRGAVLATELKNNASKMARWTAAALVGGVDIIKLGYVSRTSFRDKSAHVLLGTQAVKPKDFAAQMNLNMDNCWGIVRAMLGMAQEKMEEEGKYLLVRDPNKAQLRLYSVPTGTVEVAAESDGDEDEEARADAEE